MGTELGRERPPGGPSPFDAFVLKAAWLVARFRIVAIVGIVLALCAVVYLIAWGMGRRG